MSALPPECGHAHRRHLMSAMCQKRTFATTVLKYALARQTMLYLITKALLSGVIIMAASEAAKRSPAYVR